MQYFRIFGTLLLARFRARTSILREGGPDDDPHLS